MLKLRQFRNIHRGEQFAVGCDPGTGENNYSCCQFISRKRLDVPLVYHTSEMATTMTNDLHPILSQIYSITGVRPIVAYERGNGGVFELTRLSELNRDMKYEIFTMPDKKDKLGWDTNVSSRPKMLSELKTAIDKQLLNVYDKITIEEMFSFIITDTGKAKAEKTAVDDAVMALAIAWQVHLISPLIVDTELRDEPRQIGGYGRR